MGDAGRARSRLWRPWHQPAVRTANRGSSHGGRFTPSAALGSLSLIVWTLIVTISVKYCLFVMRADNHGEGGILALMSLIGANSFARGVKLLKCVALVRAKRAFRFVQEIKLTGPPLTTSSNP